MPIIRVYLTTVFGSDESQPTFRMNLSPPSPGQKNNQSKKKKRRSFCISYLIHTSFSLDLYFYPEDEDVILLEISDDFHRNTERYIPQDGTLKVVVHL